MHDEVALLNHRGTIDLGGPITLYFIKPVSSSAAVVGVDAAFSLKQRYTKLCCAPLPQIVK